MLEPVNNQTRYKWRTLRLTRSNRTHRLAETCDVMIALYKGFAKKQH